MSDKSLTIRVKIGNNEVEISGSGLEDISKTLENLPQIVDKISTSFNSIAPISDIITSPKQEAKTTVEEFPTISTQIGGSCPEAIIAILSTDWGRKNPRNLGEITDAMKVNALHFPTGTIKGRLTDLTKRGILRRIRSEKGYGYVVVK